MFASKQLDLYFLQAYRGFYALLSSYQGEMR